MRRRGVRRTLSRLRGVHRVYGDPRGPYVGFPDSSQISHTDYGISTIQPHPPGSACPGGDLSSAVEQPLTVRVVGPPTQGNLGEHSKLG